MDTSISDLNRARNALRIVEQMMHSQKQIAMAKIIVPASCRVSRDVQSLLYLLDQRYRHKTEMLNQARLAFAIAFNTMSLADQSAFTVREGPDLQRCVNMSFPHTLYTAQAEIIHTRELLYRTRETWWRETNYRAAKQLLPQQVILVAPGIQRRIDHHDRLVGRWVQDRQGKEVETREAFIAMSSNNQRVFREWYGDILSMIHINI